MYENNVIQMYTNKEFLKKKIFKIPKKEEELGNWALCIIIYVCL